MIKQIKVSQYRCFHSLDIELNQHQVLAGANGSGKTTLLDIPTLFGELLASNDINQVFFEPTPSQNYARASNPIELIHNLQGNCFSLSLAVQIPAHIKDSLLNSFVNFQPETVRYELLFEIVANEKLQIAQEYLFLSSSAAENNFSVIQRRNGENSTLFQAEGQPQTFNFTISKEQLALSSMPADHRFFLATLWFRDYLQQYTCLYQPQGLKLRQASPPRYRTGLNSEGWGLPWQILSLKKNQADEFEEWLELVQLALPSIQDIRVIEREDDRHAYIKIKYQNGIEVPSSGLSYGTLSILALTILPYVTPLPQIITLEEPENGIHPSAIEAVLQAIRAVDSSQIWLTTHSPIVLAHTHLEDMLCMRLKDEGRVDVISGKQHPRLKEWQGGIHGTCGVADKQVCCY
jgi:predicted ATPase